MITDALYEAIKKQLKKAKKPVTCNDLIDVPEIHDMEDVDVTDVSNALAALWRRGAAQRFTYTKGHGRGPRYSYMLQAGTDIEPRHVPAGANIDELEIDQQPDGSVVIRTSRLMITVKPFTK